MNQARRFALQTFAIGTCISLGGFGVFLLTMSKLTGTTNVSPVYALNILFINLILVERF
jgi:hypothetical protein